VQRELLEQLDLRVLQVLPGLVLRAQLDRLAQRVQLVLRDLLLLGLAALPMFGFPPLRGFPAPLRDAASTP
jgi:hypothetical protein